MKRLVKKAEEILNINNGDYVDFGPYGQLFVCNNNYEDDKYWVTDLEDDRNNRNAEGWAISKDLAKTIVNEENF